jgi:hypothetical protein
MRSVLRPHNDTSQELAKASSSLAASQRLVVSCQLVASQQGHEHKTRAISTVRIHYQAMTDEDMEVIVFAIEICKVCRLVRAL